MAWRHSLIGILCAIILLSADTGYSQTGYSALRQPVYAKAVGMSGAFTGQSGEVSSLLWNPAGLHGLNSLTGQISFQQHLTDVNATELLAGMPLWRGNAGIGIDYWNYGQFEQRDSQGNITGNDVGAYETWLTAGYSYPLSKTASVGLSMQLFHRNLADHTSTILFWSLGWQRYYPEQKFGIGIVASHLGTRLGCGSLGSEPFPTQLMAGVTKQLAHLPLELYLDTEYGIRENSLRGIIGGEFTITDAENLFLRFGISSDRFRQQTQVVGADFFAGSAFGLGIRLAGFQMDYALQTFGGAGTIHSVTLKTLP